MQVIILAGGKGTRLRPLTFAFPKPLVPIGDRPIIDIILCQLKRAGVTDVVLSTGYLAELMEAYCGNGSKWDLPLRYVREQTPLNTAGVLSLVDNLQENFVVMNGDVLTTLNVREIWDFHKQSAAKATLGICKRDVNIDFGVVKVADSGALKEYIEKPKLPYYVSMGVNVLNRRCQKFVQREEPLSMPDLLTRMNEAGEKVICYVSDHEWLDIGRLEDYQSAQEKFEESKKSYLPDER